MKIIKIISSYLDTNCYLVINDEKAIVIDPCIDYNFILNKYNVTINAVLLTHGHIDHFYKIKTFFNKNILFYLHKETIVKLSDSYKNCSAFVGEKITVDVSNENVIKIYDSFKFEINGLIIDTIATPGHTNDSVSFLVKNNLFTGDALFKGSIGRVDLPTGNQLIMNKTIETFKNMKSNYQVYPGHGEDTDLDYEKNTNFYFR